MTKLEEILTELMKELRVTGCSDVVVTTYGVEGPTTVLNVELCEKADGTFIIEDDNLS